MNGMQLYKVRPILHGPKARHLQIYLLLLECSEMNVLDELEHLELALLLLKDVFSRLSVLHFLLAVPEFEGISIGIGVINPEAMLADIVLVLLFECFLLV